MSDALFDVYQNVGSAKELWGQLESKYMAEDASSKKFLVSNFNNYKMVNSSSVSSNINKLPPSLKDFKHSLKHNKDELSLLQLGSHFCIEESLRAEESGKGKGKEIDGSSSVNMMDDEFVALAATGKEAEWLRNLIYEIPLWPKLMSPMSSHCDSAATLAKAYCQIYNGKSRHIGVRHSMVRELITNGVISVDFVRSQQKLADHLTKELALNLVHKLSIGMGLKSIKISNDETPNSLLANAMS
nr:zinc finger, CCHC-type [Tanacetum cinerariifolium]